MNKKIKIIDNFDASKLTETDKTVIDFINGNFESFISSHKMSSWCQSTPFTPTAIQRLSKKLGYNSAKEMKEKLVLQYIEKLQNMVYMDEINDDCNKDLINVFDYSNGINKYLNYIKTNLFNFDWKQITKLEQNIKNSKNIFVYQQDPIFEFSSFDWYCSLNKINILRIYSINRLEFIKKFMEVDNKSLLIVTKFGDEIDEQEKLMLDFFNKNQANIYIFSSHKINYSLLTNNIVLGNTKRVGGQKRDLFIFKSLYDQLMNIVIYNLFIKMKN